MVLAGAQSIQNLLPDTKEFLLSESQASLSQSRHPAFLSLPHFLVALRQRQGALQVDTP